MQRKRNSVREVCEDWCTLWKKTQHKTSKETLQANLEQSGVVVYGSTISCTVNQVGVKEYTTIEGIAQKARLMFAKTFLDKSQSWRFGQALSWTDETKVEPFGNVAHKFVCR